MNNPNLFRYATSELSHDAFIAWLLSWSDPYHKNEPLHSFSRHVLRKFFEISDIPVKEITRVKVKTQHKNIDVLTIVTDDRNQDWAIIIENKLFTNEHSDQLKRYREAVQADEDLKSLPEENIIGIYYKMWEQSNLQNVKESKYSHFGRKMMIDLFENYEKGCSHIVDDYFRYLEGLQGELDAFQEKTLDKWDQAQWTGFYSRLKSDLKDGDYGYVANRSGGFMGYWLGEQKIKDGISIYVQSEQDKLCIKLHVADLKLRQFAKNFWHTALIQYARKTNLNIVKPKVMKTGQWFTIGVLNTSEKPWMVANENKQIDYNESLSTLKKVIRLVESVSSKKPEFINGLPS